MPSALLKPIGGGAGSPSGTKGGLFSRSVSQTLRTTDMEGMRADLVLQQREASFLDARLKSCPVAEWSRAATFALESLSRLLCG